MAKNKQATSLLQQCTTLSLLQELQCPASAFPSSAVCGPPGLHACPHPFPAMPAPKSSPYHLYATLSLVHSAASHISTTG